MKRRPIVIVAAAGGAAGFLLRLWQLRRAAAAEHLPAGDVSTWCLGLLCGAVVLFLALASRRLAKREAYADSFSSGSAELAVSLAAAALVLAAAAWSLLAGAAESLSLAAWAVRFLGVLTALCMGAVALLRRRGTVPGFALHVVPCVYLVARLILEFKQWSTDPAVLDYCFDLFFSIAAMCAAYHLCSFCFGKGQRRISVFWCMSCVLFAAVGLADGGLERRLLLAGLGLWAGVNGWELLEDED